jgi:chemotaxis protein MotB
MLFQDSNTDVSSYDEEENYFVSMTDMMIGVLFIFIIMLMVFALDFREQADEQTRLTEVQELTVQEARRIAEQLEVLQQEVRSEISALAEAQEVRSALLKDISRALEREGLSVEIDEINGVLRLTEDAVRFEPSSSDLVGEALINVNKIAAALMSVLPNYSACFEAAGGQTCPEGRTTTVETVFIEGHTDKTGSDELNWQLSSQRAVNTYRAIDASQPVLRQLFNRAGRQLISVSGYAATRPIETGFALDALAKNRRIDLRFVMETDQRGRLQEILQLTDDMKEQIRALRAAAGG